MVRFLSKISFFGLIFLLTIFSGCKKVNNDCNLNDYPNAPQQSWFTSYNGSGEESHGHYIINCSDGGFLQIGETGSIESVSKIFVVKTNTTGSLLWKKEFILGGHNLGNSAIELSDGYLICGSQNKNSALLKLNKNDGSIIFQSYITNGGTNAFEHVTETPNGLIAVGYNNAQDDQNTFYTEGAGYITFLNHQGEKTGGFSINNYLSQAYRIKYFNTDIYISGLTANANDYGLIKMDTLGNILWAKTFGGSDSDHCFGMDIANDGSIFLTGHTLSGTENWDTYTMKIDNNGNQLWEFKNGNPRGFRPKYIHDEAWGVRATPDGGCIVVAGTGDEYGGYKRRCGNDGDDSNTWHVFLIKYTSSGSVEWQRTYGSTDRTDWAGEDIALTNEGAAIIAVDNGEFGFLKLQSL